MNALLCNLLLFISIFPSEPGGGGRWDEASPRWHHQCGRDHAIMLIAWTMDNRLSSLSAGLF
jgi:hypothetical protein